MTDGNAFRPMHTDGVYFGLPFDDYKAEPRLSSHLVLPLLRSPTDFWARSWMNPEPPDEETDAKDLGSAYHVRVVEGKAAFLDQYARALDLEEAQEEYGDELLVTSEDVKAQLRVYDQRLSGKKQELVDRLTVCDPEALIWDRMVEDHAIENEGKKLLKSNLMAQIELAAAHIEFHPQLKDVFRDGMPEVSIFWHDEIELPSGELVQVPMKARLDYLKDTIFADLKSFSHQRVESIEISIYAAMASRKYHIQGSIYYAASDKAADLIRDGKVNVISGPTPSDAWLKSVVANTKDRTMFFVFQQTGPAPVAKGIYFQRVLSARDAGERVWRQAMELFVENKNAYGDNIWVTILPVEYMEDEKFPQRTYDL